MNICWLLMHKLYVGGKCHSSEKRYIFEHKCFIVALTILLYQFVIKWTGIKAKKPAAKIGSIKEKIFANSVGLVEWLGLQTVQSQVHKNPWQWCFTIMDSGIVFIYSIYTYLLLYRESSPQSVQTFSYSKAQCILLTSSAQLPHSVMSRNVANITFNKSKYTNLASWAGILNLP